MENYRSSDAVASAQTATECRYVLRIRGDSELMTTEKTHRELKSVCEKKGHSIRGIGLKIETRVVTCASGTKESGQTDLLCSAGLLYVCMYVCMYVCTDRQTEPVRKELGTVECISLNVDTETFKSNPIQYMNLQNALSETQQNTTTQDKTEQNTTKHNT